MIEIRDNWEHKQLCKEWLLQTRTRTKLIMQAMPKDKTQAESELYKAFEIIMKYTEESEV